MSNDGSVRFPVRYDDQNLLISARTRSVGDDLIVAMHGFGCSREVFNSIFESDLLRRFSICAFDFPSHGDSTPLNPHLTSLESYADIAYQVIDQLQYRRLFLVCHSMGAAVGVLAVPQLRLLSAFVSIEGNLVGEDCGIVSRNTASQDASEYVTHGFGEFVGDLRNSDCAAEQAWADWYARCDPPGLHEISRSLVAWSDSGDLLKRFLTIPEASYVYGGMSSVDHVVPLLEDVDVTTQRIPHAGHFIMLDQPGWFCEGLRAAFDGVASAAPAEVTNMAGLAC